MRRKILGWIAGGVALVIGLFFVAVVLLYMPPVQRYAVRKTAAYVTETTGMDVQVGGLRLAFLFDLSLREVLVKDTLQDSLLYVQRLDVDLDFSSMLRGEMAVDGIRLDRVHVDTKDLIPDVWVKGALAHLFIDSHGVHFPQETVVVNRLLLDGADISLRLGATESAEDSTDMNVPWDIRLEKFLWTDSRVDVTLPDDSMQVALTLDSLLITGGAANLSTLCFEVGEVALSADSLSYDRMFLPREEGLDVNHIALSGIHTRLEALHFNAGDLSSAARLCDLRLKERSGWHVTGAQGAFSMDSLRAELPRMNLRTASSTIAMHARADFSAFGKGDEGQLELGLKGAFGKNDVLRLLPGLPETFRTEYPNLPLGVEVVADGNFSCLSLRKAEIAMHEVLHLTIGGHVMGLDDMQTMSGKLALAAQTHDVNFFKTLVQPDSLDFLSLPPMTLEGGLLLDGPEYTADLQLYEDSGVVSLHAFYDARRQAYQAAFSVNALQLQHFLPQDSLYEVSLKGNVMGTGTDPYSRKTALQADLELSTLQYASYDFGGVHLQTQLQDGFGSLRLTSDNELLQLSSQVDAMVASENTDLTFSVDLQKVDLQALRITEAPFRMGMCLHVDGSTDLKERHAVVGGISDMTMSLRDTVYRPKDLQLEALAYADTTHLKVETGDFHLNFESEDGYETIIQKMDHLFTMAEGQLERRVLAQDSLTAVLPVMNLQLLSGKDNPVSNSLSVLGYSFENLRLALETAPDTGVNGGAALMGMNLNGIALDTVQTHIYQDTVGVKFDVRVCNGPKNKQFIFDSRMLAYLEADGAGLDVLYHDEHGDTGVDFGVKVTMAEEGLRASFSNSRPIMAYRHFDINTGNYVYLKRDRRVEADVEMQADDGTRIKVYSTPNEEALQDLTLSLQRLNLGELMSVIPYAPRITGFLMTDVHLIQTVENLSVAMDAMVDDMAYEGAPLGNIGCNAVYLPHSGNSHYIDAHVSCNEQEVMSLFGTYLAAEDDDLLEAEMNLMDFPLTMVNGFLTGQPITLEGLANGALQVAGTTSAPLLNGWLSLSDAGILSPEYSLNLRWQDDSVKMVDSRLNFDRLQVYSTGKNPLVLDGTVDFSDFERMRLDLRVNASDFELINAKRTKQSSAYGKVYVNLGARISGDFNEMDVAGRLNVLGNTDVSYILRDSPLTVEDRLSDLVTFVDFSDTETPVESGNAPSMNMNVAMQVHIDQAAQVHCLLSEDRSKYIDLEGGGELMMTYTPQGELTLNGRYTVLSGEMKYSLPVIPLKTFTLASGSYVDFKGPVLNPTLNLSATERVRTTVTENDVPRSVNFDVGLTITQTLENMGLEFTLAAPEDLTVQNQLASMSLEQRGRLAVTMLATGMYLADSNLESFSTTNALNALLQSEISNIAGKALQTVDISVGMDTETTATGSERTDYSFRFAKRLWGNRVSIIVGGKVSTGDDVDDMGQSLIDNISVEYRLDKSATRYVSVFYDRNYESLLEGEVTEMGAGLVLRKKMARLGELFIFRDDEKKKKAVKGHDDK